MILNCDRLWSQIMLTWYRVKRVPRVQVTAPPPIETKAPTATKH